MFLKLTLWGYGLQSPLKRGVTQKSAKRAGIRKHKNIPTKQTNEKMINKTKVNTVLKYRYIVHTLIVIWWNIHNLMVAISNYKISYQENTQYAQCRMSKITLSGFLWYQTGSGQNKKNADNILSHITNVHIILGNSLI